MKFFDFGAFQKIEKMLSHDKIRFHMLFGAIHDTPCTVPRQRLMKIHEIFKIQKFLENFCHKNDDRFSDFNISGPQASRVRAYPIKISFLEGSKLKNVSFRSEIVRKLQIGTPKIDTV